MRYSTIPFMLLTLNTCHTSDKIQQTGMEKIKMDAGQRWHRCKM
jgi:hypothetical protein